MSVLAIIIMVLLCVCCFLCGGIFAANLSGKRIRTEWKRAEKYYEYNNLLCKWIVLKTRGKSLDSYFVKHCYKNVAIYGLNNIGRMFADEIINAGIDISCIIDKRNVMDYKGIRSIKPGEEISDADVIVVIPISSYISVKKGLQDKVNIPIISIEDVIAYAEGELF